MPHVVTHGLLSIVEKICIGVGNRRSRNHRSRRPRRGCLTGCAKFSSHQSGHPTWLCCRVLQVSFDVRELISVDDVMSEMQLGPNGALMYAMEYLVGGRAWTMIALPMCFRGLRSRCLISSLMRQLRSGP